MNKFLVITVSVFGFIIAAAFLVGPLFLDDALENAQDKSKENNLEIIAIALVLDYYDNSTHESSVTKPFIETSTFRQSTILEDDMVTDILWIDNTINNQNACVGMELVNGTYALQVLLGENKQEIAFSDTLPNNIYECIQYI